MKQTIDKKPCTPWLPLVFIGIVFLVSVAGCSTRMGVKPKHPDERKAYAAMSRGDYVKGIELYERVVKNKPDHAAALYYLGYGYGQMGDPELEITYYQKAIQAGYRSDEIYRNLGMAYLDRERIEDAVTAFKQALSINSKNADNHFGLGRAYRELYDEKQAIREIKKAVSLDPKEILFREYLGQIYMEAGDPEKAEEQFQKIIKLEPDHEGAKKYLDEIRKKQEDPLNSP